MVNNQSLCTGIFPDKPNIAKVIPLYKKYDKKIIWKLPTYIFTLFHIK